MRCAMPKLEECATEKKSSWWSPMHGDPEDSRWFYTEDMADAAPPSVLHLRTDVVCRDCLA